MKRKYLFFLFLIFSTSCGSSTSSLESFSSSSLIDDSSISESSSSENIAIDDVTISLIKEENYAGEIIEYDVQITPSNASNQDYVLSTSTPDILKIDGLEVRALYMGVGKLKVTTLDGLHFDEIEVEVKKPNPYSEIINLLQESKKHEKNNCHKTLFNYNFLSDLYSVETNYETEIFTDGLLTKDLNSESEIYKYIIDDTLQELTINENEMMLDEKNIPIGNASNAITLEEASNIVQLSEYNDTYGLSSLTETLLFDVNSFYMDQMVLNVELIDKIEEENCEYSFIGTCRYFAFSLDEKESELKVEGNIKFDNLNRLTFANLKIEKYLINENNEIEDNPSIIESYNYELQYGERKKLPLNKDNYYVSSFDIDLSNFDNGEGVNTIEIGESKVINIINEIPSLHFEEIYTLNIADETIIKKGATNLEIVGLKKGTTKVSVISNHGVIRDMMVTVTEPQVSRISLSYIPNFVIVDDTFEIKATCYPESASDKSYLISLKEGDETKASITLQESGTYLFTALSEGQVTIIATSLSNPVVTDEWVLTIQPKADVDEIKNKLSLKTFKATDCELVFSNDGTGSLSLQGGGEYTFAWDLRIDGTYIYIDFTNVITVTEPDRWYDFKGIRGSYTNNEASFITLVVYDLDYEENWNIQFS